MATKDFNVKEEEQARHQKERKARAESADPDRASPEEGEVNSDETPVGG